LQVDGLVARRLVAGLNRDVLKCHSYGDRTMIRWRCHVKLDDLKYLHYNHGIIYPRRGVNTPTFFGTPTKIRPPRLQYGMSSGLQWRVYTVRTIYYVEAQLGHLGEIALNLAVVNQFNTSTYTLYIIIPKRT
jgi:hypothetical protein